MWIVIFLFRLLLDSWTQEIAAVLKELSKLLKHQGVKNNYQNTRLKMAAQDWSHCQAKMLKDLVNCHVFSQTQTKHRRRWSQRLRGEWRCHNSESLEVRVSNISLITVSGIRLKSLDSEQQFSSWSKPDWQGPSLRNPPSLSADKACQAIAGCWVCFQVSAIRVGYCTDNGLHWNDAICTCHSVIFTAPPGDHNSVSSGKVFSSLADPCLGALNSSTNMFAFFQSHLTVLTSPL